MNNLTQLIADLLYMSDKKERFKNEQSYEEVVNDFGNFLALEFPELSAEEFKIACYMRSE